MCEIERVIVNNTQDLLDYREKMIINLQEELVQAGRGLKSLRDDKEKLQEQCSHLLEKQYQDDYEVQNSKKIVGNLKKTLDRYEAENKALRELVALWI